MECWATTVGNCSGSQSGEHIVSSGIFDSGNVTVSGFSWCQDGPITIGIKSAVSNILCKHHNEALSEFDSEAIQLCRFLSTNILDQPLARARHTVDGHKFEKWALKTYANLAYLGALDPTTHMRTVPDHVLTKHLFENAPIPYGMGLYFVAGTVNNHDFNVGLSWNGIRNVNDEGAIVAMAFKLNELHFVVSAVPGAAEGRLAKMGTMNGIDYSSVQVVYRPNNIVLRSHAGAGKTILLNW